MCFLRYSYMLLVLLTISNTCRSLPHAMIPVEETNLDTELSKLYQVQNEINNWEFPPNKPPIFMMGFTGSGKSTVTAYCLGKKMGYVSEDPNQYYQVLEPSAEHPEDWLGHLVDVQEDNKENCPTIGHDMVSQTFYPAYYVHPKQPFTFIDCAGWKDTGGPMAQAATTLYTQAALQKAGTIKAIVIVLGYDELNANRRQLLIDLLVILQNLVDRQNWSAIFFAFNKESYQNIRKYRLLFDQIMKTVQASKAIVEALSSTPSTLDLRDYHAAKRWVEVAPILQFLDENFTKQAFSINPLDNGSSANTLLDALAKSPEIPPECIGFPGNKTLQKQLSKFCEKKIMSQNQDI